MVREATVSIFAGDIFARVGRVRVLGATETRAAPMLSSERRSMTRSKLAVVSCTHAHARTHTHARTHARTYTHTHSQLVYYRARI